MLLSILTQLKFSFFNLQARFLIIINLKYLIKKRINIFLWIMLKYMLLWKMITSFKYYMYNSNEKVEILSAKMI